MKIILHSDSMNLLSHWENALKDRDFIVVDTIEELESIVDSIIIINHTACQKECKAMIKEFTSRGNKTIILDRIPELQRAKKLLYYGVMGYGNALMRTHFLHAAINAVEEDMIWLYPELTSQLILEIPNSQEKNSEELLQKLTPREKEVALELKEGMTYKEIAENLSISARTVKAHAQAIYHKLEVKDRIGLALLLK